MCSLVGLFSHSAARHDRFRVEKGSFVSKNSDLKVVQTGVLNGTQGLCEAPLIARQFKKIKPPKEIGEMCSRFSRTTVFLRGRGW